ncbi:hypothetical protein Bca101_026383 [Brassica carinata]
MSTKSTSMVTTKRLNTNNLCHLVWSLVAHHKLKAELSSVLCHDKASTNGVSFTSLCKLSSAELSF